MLQHRSDIEGYGISLPVEYVKFKIGLFMKELSTLRPVELSDASLLFEWRNDKDTREASHNTDEVSMDNHLSWLKSSLNNEDRLLFIYEESGVAFGTVRADLEGEVWEISWTLSPEKRGRGAAKKMVLLLTKMIQAPLRAEVKSWNIASSKIALSVGMTLKKECKGILHYVM